jgi:dCMP deaminase
MLICLVGPPQAGKNSLADHLVAQHGYERVHLGSSSPHLEPGSYASSSDFLDHATRTWRRNYVTTDLISKAKLVEFAKRPFVAIVAVDAPLGTRFKRAVAA